MTLLTDRIMNNARVHLPGATDSVLQLELFNVLNDFFQQSNIWQEDTPFAVKQADPSLATPPATTYYIIPQASASIVRLLWIVDGNQRPINGVMATPGELQLANPPGQNDTYTATVALTVNDPVMSSGSYAGFPEFQEWPVNKYSTGIIDGLVGRMMTQPAKPYSNPQLGAVRLRSFNSTISTARTEAIHGNVNNGQSWRFPAFARGRRR